MIQRIQSLYLLLSALLGSLLFVLPFCKISSSNLDVSYELKVHGLVQMRTLVMETYSLLALVLLIIALSIITIFFYKNRLTQLKIGRVNILCVLGFIFLIFYYIDKASNFYNVNNIKYELGVFVPLLQLILVFLANRAIKKDEELVRSADRLR